MSIQELLALYRISDIQCPFCKRIVMRYEKTLLLRPEDKAHLHACLLLKDK